MPRAWLSFCLLEEKETWLSRRPLFVSRRPLTSSYLKSSISAEGALSLPTWKLELPARYKGPPQKVDWLW